jgi:hypothetical protein
MEGDKDFLPANRIAFKVSAVSGWQTHEVPLPANGKMIHLRVHFPLGRTQIQTLAIKDKAGKVLLSLQP